MVKQVISNRFLRRAVTPAEIERQRQQVRQEKLEKMKKRAYQKAYERMQILIEKRKGQQDAIRDAGFSPDATQPMQRQSRFR